jgi:hypothetical protein
MSNGAFQAWLFIKGMKPETWVVSPGPGVIQSMGGQPYDRVFVPGLLFTFPTVKAATQAALRCHSYLAPMFQQIGIPPMAIDIGPRPKILPVLVFDQQAGTVIITQDAMKYLASEPLEVLPGPDTRLETGEILKTNLLPASSLNVGWSLPTLAVETTAGGTPYVRRTEPAIINIQMGPKRETVLPFEIPWKMLVLCGIAGFLLLGAYLVTAALVGKVKPAKTAVFETPTESPDAALTPLSLEHARVDTKGVFGAPTATPIPPGFGSVVIRTVPADAEIYVNHRLVAKRSPATLRDMSNQEVLMLNVSRQGYKDHMQIFNVEANRETVLKVALEKETSPSVFPRSGSQRR